MSLRAILGGARVKKKSPVKKTPVKKTTPANNAKASSTNYDDDDDDDDDDAGEDFDDDEFKLDDSGLVASLADDLALRDVVQALRYARGNMFDPLPGLTRPGPDEVDSYADDDASDAQRRLPKSMAGRHRHKGYVGNGARIADLANMRRRMPPLATTAHIAALLPNATATERETVTLVRAGMLCKVVQPQWRRGMVGSRDGGGSGGGGSGDSPGQSKGAGDARYRRALAMGDEALGEVLIETAELEKLVQGSSGLGADTRTAMCQWLRGNSPAGNNETRATFTINGHTAPQMTVSMVDELVRAGFLVGHGASAGLVGSISLTGHRSAGHNKGSQSDTGDVYARPEDRTTLLSLETVARAASGSFDAVGGVGAVYRAGGGGARSAASFGQRQRQRQRGGLAAAATVEDMVLAIPGHGTFVKLVSGALAYLVGILARTPHGETLTSSLRERWDAGGNITKSAFGMGMGGRGLKRVPLSRTRKWKDFYGLSFDWVLAEAIGSGLVELFDTGSVGRGVRMLL